MVVDSATVIFCFYAKDKITLKHLLRRQNHLIINISILKYQGCIKFIKFRSSSAQRRSDINGQWYTAPYKIIAKRTKPARLIIRIGDLDCQNQRDKIAEDKSSGLGFPRLYELCKTSEIHFL